MIGPLFRLLDVPVPATPPDLIEIRLNGLTIKNAGDWEDQKGTISIAIKGAGPAQATTLGWTTNDDGKLLLQNKYKDYLLYYGPVSPRLDLDIRVIRPADGAGLKTAKDILTSMSSAVTAVPLFGSVISGALTLVGQILQGISDSIQDEVKFVYIGACPATTAKEWSVGNVALDVNLKTSAPIPPPKVPATGTIELTSAKMSGDWPEGNLTLSLTVGSGSSQIPFNFPQYVPATGSKSFAQVVTIDQKMLYSGDLSVGVPYSASASVTSNAEEKEALATATNSALSLGTMAAGLSTTPVPLIIASKAFQAAPSIISELLPDSVSIGSAASIFALANLTPKIPLTDSSSSKPNSPSIVLSFLIVPDASPTPAQKSIV